MACGLRFLLVCGILVPPPGIEPVYAVLQGRFLTTGPPGKSSPKKLLGRYSYPYFTAEKNKAQQSAVIHPRWGTKTQTKLDLALIDGKTALFFETPGPSGTLTASHRHCLCSLADSFTSPLNPPHRRYLFPLLVLLTCKAGEMEEADGERSGNSV